jgi:hypothetical protein
MLFAGKPFDYEIFGNNRQNDQRQSRNTHYHSNGIRFSRRNAGNAARKQRNAYPDNINRRQYRKSVWKISLQHCFYFKREKGNGREVSRRAPINLLCAFFVFFHPSLRG